MMAADRSITCDECGQPIQIVCLLGDASNEAVRALLMAAHKRFHAEDRALAEAQREAVRQMTDLGPLATDTFTEADNNGR